MLRPLYPDQQIQIDKLRAALREGNKRIVGQAPTGNGKTVIAAHIIQAAVNNGYRVAFVAPAISLIDQTVERFHENGITSVGVIQADHPATDYTQPIQVCSTGTIKRRGLSFLSRVLGGEENTSKIMVIFDEIHEWHQFYSEWMTRWSNIVFIGFSATPWRPQIQEHFQKLVVLTTLEELMALGRLTPYRFFVMSKPDLSKVRVVAGEFNLSDLSSALNTRELVDDIVGKWVKHGEGRPTLCFAVDRAHAKSIQTQFEAAGIPCGYIDANTPREERNVIGRDFHAGKYKIVVNVNCLSRGVDWDVRCIILARSTKSERLFVQMIGRGLRTAEGKKDCIILDHSSTTLELGFPHDIEAEQAHTNQGKARDLAPREKPEAKPKECPSCGFLKPPKTPVCPACGVKAEPQPDVTEKEAELVELKEGKRRNRTDTAEQKARFFAELKGYAAQKQYAAGWASHAYKERYGVWPNKYEKVAPKQPTELITNFVRWRAMKRAKSKNA